MNIDIFKIHYDMNALEIIKNIQVENSSTGFNTVIQEISKEEALLFTVKII
jgi:hypothetical protein